MHGGFPDIPAAFHLTSIARNVSCKLLTTPDEFELELSWLEPKWALQIWYEKKRPHGDISSGLRPKKHCCSTRFTFILSVIWRTRYRAR